MVFFLIFIIGLRDGLCMVIIVFLFNLCNVWVKLIVIVDFFFFVGVGLIVVIKIIFLFCFVCKCFIMDKESFVL